MALAPQQNQQRRLRLRGTAARSTTSSIGSSAPSIAAGPPSESEKRLDPNPGGSWKPPAELPLEKCICPVCLDIFLEPVTMPCGHSVCLPCFDQCFEKASLCCPMCRARVSSWARRRARQPGGLVNTELWDRIRALYPERCRKRLGERETNGSGGGDGAAADGGGEDGDLVFHSPVRICRQGEVQREFKEQYDKLQAEREVQKEEQQRMSEQLIARLLAEEERVARAERAQQEATDHVLAQRLMEEDLAKATQSTPSTPRTRRSRPASGSSRSQPLEPTPLSRSIERFLSPVRPASPSPPGDDRQAGPSFQPGGSGRSSGSAGSCGRADGASSGGDSITQELNHFKPIVSCPRTPPKRLPDGRVLSPAIVKATPIKPAAAAAAAAVPAAVPAASRGRVTVRRPCRALTDGAWTAARPAAGGGGDGRYEEQLLRSRWRRIAEEREAVARGDSTGGDGDDEAPALEPPGGPDRYRGDRYRGDDDTGGGGGDGGGGRGEGSADGAADGAASPQGKRRLPPPPPPQPGTTKTNGDGCRGDGGGGEEEEEDETETERTARYGAEAERVVRQQQDDLRLAQRLQRQFDSEANAVDRRPGSDSAYGLRRHRSRVAPGAGSSGATAETAAAVPAAGAAKPNGRRWTSTWRRSRRPAADEERAARRATGGGEGAAAGAAAAADKANAGKARQPRGWPRGKPRPKWSRGKRSRGKRPRAVAEDTAGADGGVLKQLKISVFQMPRAESNASC